MVVIYVLSVLIDLHLYPVYDLLSSLLPLLLTLPASLFGQVSVKLGGKACLN